MVLEAPQALDGAQVLVEAALSVPAGQALASPAQQHPPPAAADLPQGHVHLQLRPEKAALDNTGRAEKTRQGGGRPDASCSLPGRQAGLTLRSERSGKSG